MCSTSELGGNNPEYTAGRMVMYIEEILEKVAILEVDIGQE